MLLARLAVSRPLVHHRTTVSGRARCRLCYCCLLGGAGDGGRRAGLDLARRLGHPADLVSIVMGWRHC